MHIRPNLLNSNVSLLFKESILPVLSPLQRKITIVATIMFSLLAAAYLLHRCCSFIRASAEIEEDDIPVPDLIKVKNQPQTEEDYIRIAEQLHLDGQAELPDGTVLSQEEILLQVIEMNPNSSMAYNYLGTIIDALSKVKLPDGTEKNQQELFLKAVELDPKSSTAICHLGATLEGGGSFDLPDGSQLTREQQFVRVIKKHNAVAHPSKITIALPNHPAEMTQKELFMRAIDEDEQNATAHYNLASSLKPGEKIFLPSLGTYVTAKDLFIETMLLNEEHAEAYSDYANRVPKNAPPLSVANESNLTKKELYIKAIELDPADASAYYNLSLILNYDEKARLYNGKKMTARQLLLKAIDLDPYYFGYYAELLNQLSATDTVTLLDGTKLTPKQLLDKIDDLPNKYGLDMSPY